MDNYSEKWNLAMDIATVRTPYLKDGHLDLTDGHLELKDRHHT